MDDDADRRASRRADADAVPASAGAVGLRPHAGGDEPPAHRGRLSAPGGTAARGAAGPRAVVRLHRRPSRRDRGRLRRPRWRWSARSASPRRSASNIRRAPARPPPARPARCRRPRRTAGCSELQALLRAQQAAFNADCVGLTLPVLFTGPGRHPGQIAGRSPFLQPVHVTGPRRADRHAKFRCRSPPHTPTHLSGNPHRGESLRLSQARRIPATVRHRLATARP